MVSSNFPNRPFRLEENCWIRYQDVGSNLSNVGGELWIRKNSYSPTWSNGNSNFTFHINGGQVAGWGFTFDFRNSDALRLCYVEVNVGHNADGTKSFSIDGYASVDTLGYTEVHSGITAPTIPRASQATFNGPDLHSGVPGQPWNIATNRASGSFTHDIDWYFGNASGRALTNVGDGGTWTPPLSTISELPNATTGVGRIRTYTNNGGSFIGVTETAYRLTVPSTVIPTWSSAVVEEGTSGLSSIIGSGRYLQGISRLKGTISGAAGVYGSTITAQSHSAGGETVNGAVVTFSQPISVSGTSVPVVQTITDSRGRQRTQTTNINVLPYSRPVLSTVSVDRVDASNNLDPVGTRLRLGITGAVQSIINSTERNRLTLRVYTKLRSATDWGSPTNIVVDSTSLAYNSNAYLAGPFAVSNAYDVKVELIDKFNTTTSQTQVGTGEVFQHWSTGLGVGKYWERGMVDAAGDIYHRSGALVEPVGTIVAWAGNPAVRAIPTGWLLCNGQEVSRTTYPDLWQTCGSLYGGGNGTSTFNIPDLRRRMPVGQQSGDGDFGNIGQRGGHRDIPQHSHLFRNESYSVKWGSNSGNIYLAGGGNMGVGQPTSNELTVHQGVNNATENTGNSASTNNLPPYIVVNYLIKAL